MSTQPTVVTAASSATRMGCIFRFKFRTWCPSPLSIRHLDSSLSTMRHLQLRHPRLFFLPLWKGIGSRSYWGSRTLIWCPNVPSACLVGSTSSSAFLMMLTETALHIGSPLNLSHAVMLRAGCLQRNTGSANWEGLSLQESPLHVSLCPPGGQISSAARGVWAPHQLSTRQITLDLGSDKILPTSRDFFQNLCRRWLTDVGRSGWFAAYCLV